MKNTEGFLGGEEVGKELRKNFEWAGQRTREKSTASIKEKAEKGKELRVMLSTWMLCYARNHETTRVLDAYDPYHEATMLTELLEEEANGLRKLLDFKLKRTDMDFLSVDDEMDAVHVTVQNESTRRIEEEQKERQG